MKKILIVAMLLSCSAFGQSFTFDDLMLDEKRSYAESMEHYWAVVGRELSAAQKADAVFAEQEGDETLSADELAETTRTRAVALRRAAAKVVVVRQSIPEPRDARQRTLDWAVNTAQEVRDRESKALSRLISSGASQEAIDAATAAVVVAQDALEVATAAADSFWES